MARAASIRHGDLAGGVPLLASQRSHSIDEAMLNDAGGPVIEGVIVVVDEIMNGLEDVDVGVLEQVVHVDPPLPIGSDLAAGETDQPAVMGLEEAFKGHAITLGCQPAQGLDGSGVGLAAVRTGHIGV